ncbi:acyltransferase [uncultured Cohaesibacter sp.]|uniref:acyltransferase family protein n=1 Tax=uncultured Cohaesibacter sp. TaxID=1002546 RepID=UPI0029C62BC0|nr:acyltransferase [uncultured Cohaesibacter sp.]
MFHFLKSPFFSLNPKRDLTVDTIRGMACIALVAFHVVGGDPDQGMAVGVNDWLYRMLHSFTDMRMPLFSFISGIVFFSFPKSGTGFHWLVGKKARRLLLPLLTVGTLCWLSRVIMGIESEPLYKVYFSPYNVYWYLQSTFLVMSLFLLVNYCAMRRADRREFQSIANMNAIGLGVLGAYIHVFQFPYVTQFLSLQKAFYLMPFFMSGYLFGQVAQVYAVRVKLGQKALAALILGGFIGLGFAMVDGGNGFETATRRAVCIPVGILTALSLFTLAPRVRFLAWVGDKSYAIYLFHVFFTGATEMVWRKLLPAMDIHFGFLGFFAAGLLGPIILSWFILKVPLGRWLVLGLAAPKFMQERFGIQRAH